MVTASQGPKPAAVDARPLELGWFYIPKLDPFARPVPIPVSMSRFIAQFRAEHNRGGDRLRHFDFAIFGDVADHLHLLVRDPNRNSWKFERFAPSYIARIGADLTGTDIRDARFAPYNLRLELKLERLLQERTPFYVPTRIEELGGERISHRLLIPLSVDGPTITHCLLMSV